MTGFIIPTISRSYVQEFMQSAGDIFLQPLSNIFYISFPFFDVEEKMNLSALIATWSSDYIDILLLLRFLRR